MKNFISIFVFILLIFPQVSFANTFEEALGQTFTKSVKEVKCNTGKWLDTGETVKGAPIWICASFKTDDRFNGQPAMIVVKAGKVVAASGVMTKRPKKVLIKNFLELKSVVNMRKECTQKKISIGLEQVYYQCGQRHVILGIDKDGKAPNVRIIYFRNLKQDFNIETDFGSSKKEADFSDFL